MKKGTKLWIDDGIAGRVFDVCGKRDLALIVLDEAYMGNTAPWREAANVEDLVTSVGYPKSLKDDEPDEVDSKILNAGVGGKFFTLEQSLEEGMSGGGLFRNLGTTAYLIGVLKARHNGQTAGRAIGFGVVKEYCQEHGVVLATAAASAKPTRKKYDESKYLEWLRGYTRQIDFRGLKAGKKAVQAYEMDQLYIPLKTDRPLMGKAKKQLAQERVKLEDAVKSHQHLVIQGAAGSGKTTFLRQLAWQCCRLDERQEDQRFPIFVSIAQLDRFIETWMGKEPWKITNKKSPRWIAAYLACESDEKKWGLDFEYFDDKLGRRETLVLLDGLDEASSVERRESMVGLFEEARTAYAQCRWVVTTRPRAYEGKSTLRDFVTCAILELEPEQIHQFLLDWSRCLKDGDASAAEEHRKDLQNALDHSPPEISRMARNPLMLSALAVVHYNEKRLPDQRAELYECILEWLAKSRKEKEGRLRPELLLKYFGYLAFAMQDVEGHYRTRIGKGKAAELLAEKFQVVEAGELLEQEDIDSGILASEGADIKFYHRSFEEYLAARYLAESREIVRWTETQSRLLRAEWRETFVLLAGVLYGKGEDVLHEFLERILAHGQGMNQLADRARVVGLVGTMLNDLRALPFALVGSAETAYGKLRQDVMRIFEVDGAPELGVKTRAEVADALGQAGDPRLCLPDEDRYWVLIEGHKGGRYQIGRYPVTVFEYSKYIDAGGKLPGEWDEQRQWPSRPVVRVSWHEAVAYAKWVGGTRLATEQEWEHAARGSDGREYAWGSEPEPNEDHANFGMAVGRPTAVGLFANGNTPEGVADMAGNVWEWTSTDFDKVRKVARGGSCVNGAGDLRAAFRYWYLPDFRDDDLGFRLVRE